MCVLSEAFLVYQHSGGRTVGERVWNLACWWWCSRRSPRMRSLVFEAAEFWDKVHRKYIDTYCTGLPKVNFGFLKTCILDFRQYTKALMYLVCTSNTKTQIKNTSKLCNIGLKCQGLLWVTLYIRTQKNLYEFQTLVVISCETFR